MIKHWLQLIVVSGFVFGAGAGPNESEDITFQKNLELLQVQMKLESLSRLQDAGLFIPRKFILDCQEQQKILLQELGSAQRVDFGNLDAWLAEEKKVKNAEDLEFQKLAEKYGRKLVKEAREAAETTKSYDKIFNSMDITRKKNALHLARSVEALIKEHKGSASTGEFAQSMRQLYRNSILDTDQLVRELVKLEGERKLIEGSLTIMKEVQTKLEWTDPSDVAKTKLSEAIVRYHQNMGGDLTDKEIEAANKKVKEVIGKLQKCVENAHGAWSKMKEIEEDKTINPTAMKTAKNFAMLGAFCSSVLEVVKDMDQMKALAPLVDVLDFYAQAISLVPTVAQKVNAMVVRTDQDYSDARILNEFAQKIPRELGSFQKTSLCKALQIKVSFGELGQNITREEHAVRFYMLVDEKVVPRGYATLSKEHYERLAQVVADERLITAMEKASRGVSDLAMNLIWETRDASPLSGAVAQSYKDALAKEARKVTFTEKELLDLATGNDMKTVSRWEALRDARLTSLAEEMSIRRALNRFSESDRKEWRAFVEILKKANLALAPGQILNLFNFYMQSGSREVLLKYLNREREARQANRKGFPRIGIPDVGIPPQDEIRPNSDAVLNADIIVSNLAPGTSMPAEVTWTLPDWAGQKTIRQTTTLSNGLATVRQNVRVPKDIKRKKYSIDVEVKATLGSYVIDARSTGWVTVAEEKKEKEVLLPLKGEEVIENYALEGILVSGSYRGSSFREGEVKYDHRIYIADKESGPFDVIWLRYIEENADQTEFSGRYVTKKRDHDFYFKHGYVDRVWNKKKNDYEDVLRIESTVSHVRTKPAPTIVLKLDHVMGSVNGNQGGKYGRESHQSVRMGPETSYSWGESFTWPNPDGKGPAGHSTWNVNLNLNIPAQILLRAKDVDGLERFESEEMDIHAKADASWDTAGLGYDRGTRLELSIYNFQSVDDGKEREKKVDLGGHSNKSLKADAVVQGRMKIKYVDFSNAGRAYPAIGLRLFVDHHRRLEVGLEFNYIITIEGPKTRTGRMDGRDSSSGTGDQKSGQGGAQENTGAGNSGAQNPGGQTGSSNREATKSGGGGAAGQKPQNPGGDRKADPAKSAAASLEGDEAWKQSDVPKALDAYTRSVRHDPSRYGAWIKLAQAQIWSGDYTGAMDSYQKVMALTPGSGDIPKTWIPYNMAEVFIAAGKLDEADKHLKAIEAAGNPGAWGHTLRGQYHMKKENAIAAMESFADAMKLDPKQGERVYDAANRLNNVRLHERALFLFDVAVALDPRYTEPSQYGRGRAMAGLNRKEQAIECFQRYLKYDTGSEWAAKARQALEELKK